MQGKKRQREESEKEDEDNEEDQSETEEPSAPKKQKLVSEKGNLKILLMVISF